MKVTKYFFCNFHNQSIAKSIIAFSNTAGGKLIIGVDDDRNIIGIEEDIFTERSEVRNRVIARVFKELNYIEQWGSGINRIKSFCLKAGLKEPFIEEINDFVGVRLFRKELFATDYDGLPKEFKIILDYLMENKTIQTKIVKEKLDVMDTKAKEILKEMTEKNLIEKKGEGRGTYYIIKDNMEI